MSKPIRPSPSFCTDHLPPEVQRKFKAGGGFVTPSKFQVGDKILKLPTLKNSLHATVTGIEDTGYGIIVHFNANHPVENQVWEQACELFLRK